jgi:Arc/MetJ-type ribon-helix-helix transcriptional regulator
MAKIKTSIALGEDLLNWVDTQIEKRRFANRTHAIEYALQQLIESEKTVGAQISYDEQQQSFGNLIMAERHSKAPKKK